MASFADKVMDRYSKGKKEAPMNEDSGETEEETGDGAEASSEDDDEHGTDGDVLCKAIEKKDGAAIEAAVRRICGV